MFDSRSFGETTWAFRYSSEGNSRSLFHSYDIATLQAHHRTGHAVDFLTIDIWAG